MSWKKNDVLLIHGEDVELTNWSSTWNRGAMMLAVFGVCRLIVVVLAIVLSLVAVVFRV